jgi:hypothetical protein
LGLDGCHFAGVWILHLKKEIAATINSKAIFACLVLELGIGELDFFSCRNHNVVKWSGGNFSGLQQINQDISSDCKTLDKPPTIPFVPCLQSHGFLSDNTM